MRRTREILRQKWELQRSHREVARAVGVGVGSMGAVLKHARDQDLSGWEEVAPLSENDLELRLCGALVHESPCLRSPRPQPSQGAG